MRIYLRSLVANKLSLLSLLVVLFAWNTPPILDTFFPVYSLGFWFRISATLIGYIASGICGYTSAGTYVGYCKTMRHLKRRRYETDATYQLKNDTVYCYRAGYRLALEDVGLTPPLN